MTIVRSALVAVSAMLVLTYAIFSSAALKELAHPSRFATAQTQPTGQKSLVLTVDDLPGALPGNDFALGDLKTLQKINRGIPAILKAHHVWAIGFVNERKLQVWGERDARAELLQMWLDNGLTLGNHTYD